MADRCEKERQLERLRVLALVDDPNVDDDEPRPWFVYFAVGDAEDRVKIGRARNVDNRMKTLGLRPLAVVTGDDRSESYYHHRFRHLGCPAPDGLGGREWFALGDEIRAEIDAILQRQGDRAPSR